MRDTIHNVRTLGLVALVAGLAATGCGSGVPSQSYEALEDERDSLELDIQYLEDDVEELEAQVYKLENAPYESEVDEQYLDEGEWREGLAASEAKRCILPNEPCGKLNDIGKWTDAVSREEGIYWSPAERAAFRKRYAAWYARNK